MQNLFSTTAVNSDEMQVLNNFFDQQLIIIYTFTFIRMGVVPIEG